ncbi:MAG: DUF2752 domain-containing protein [Actinobacteria bacterium]|nr:DUF2752 domain-containing protein [Actinomycetota bacterium]
MPVTRPVPRPSPRVAPFSAPELSAPERFALTGVGVAVAAGVWPTLTDATGVGLPCPLRTLTGIPCPFCGMTTASIHLVRGDLAGAAAANPLAILIAIFTLVMLVVLVVRTTGRLGRPAAWPDARNRIAGLTIGALALLSWGLQLHRFGLL